MLIGDSAYPLSVYPTEWKGEPIVGWGFYIGGDTPHVWTLAEIARLKQTYQFLLPIYTRSNPQSANPASDASATIKQLAYISAPKNILVQLDYEAAIDSAFESSYGNTLKNAGYIMELYGQSSTVTQNALPYGGYDIAVWTGSDYAPTSTGDQFIDVGLYDLNDFKSSAPLWNTRPAPVVIPPTPAMAPKETDVFVIRSIQGSSAIWGQVGGRYWHIASPADLDAYRAAFTKAGMAIVSLEVSAAEHANVLAGVA